MVFGWWWFRLLDSYVIGFFGFGFGVDFESWFEICINDVFSMCWWIFCMWKFFFIEFCDFVYRLFYYSVFGYGDGSCVMFFDVLDYSDE